jgi:hypothetical protein
MVLGLGMIHSNYKGQLSYSENQEEWLYHGNPFDRMEEGFGV